MQRVAVSGLAKIAGAQSIIPVKKCGLSIAHSIAMVPPCIKSTERITPVTCSEIENSTLN